MRPRAVNPRRAPERRFALAGFGRAGQRVIGPGDEPELQSIVVGAFAVLRAGVGEGGGHDE